MRPERQAFSSGGGTTLAIAALNHHLVLLCCQALKTRTGHRQASCGGRHRLMALEAAEGLEPGLALGPPSRHERLGTRIGPDMGPGDRVERYR